MASARGLSTIGISNRRIEVVARETRDDIPEDLLQDVATYLPGPGGILASGQPFAFKWCRSQSRPKLSIRGGFVPSDSRIFAASPNVRLINDR